MCFSYYQKNFIRQKPKSIVLICYHSPSHLICQIYWFGEERLRGRGREIEYRVSEIETRKNLSPYLSVAHLVCLEKRLGKKHIWNGGMTNDLSSCFFSLFFFFLNFLPQYYQCLVQDFQIE